MLIVLIGACGGAGAAESPVFDDVQLLRGFARGAGALADAGTTLDSAAIEERLKQAAGKAAVLPQAATPCALGPQRSLYDAVVPAVVAVGSVFKCGKRNDWHVGQTPATWMTITADFAIGSSGGPVFNAAGEVVGMVSRTALGRAAAPGKPPEQPPAGGEQMIFKECVSADTLRSLFAGEPGS